MARDSDGNGRGGRTAKRALRRQSTKYDMDTLDLDAMWLCMRAACASGGAIRVGATRDGGALAIGVYGDGDPYTEYLRPGDTGEGFFSDLRTIYEGLTDEWERNR